MKLRRLFKNEFTTLFTQERSHEEFFEQEIHGIGSSPSCRKKRASIWNAGTCPRKDFATIGIR